MDTPRKHDTHTWLYMFIICKYEFPTCEAAQFPTCKILTSSPWVETLHLKMQIYEQLYFFDLDLMAADMAITFKTNRIKTFVPVSNPENIFTLFSSSVVFMEFWCGQKLQPNTCTTKIEFIYLQYFRSVYISANFVFISLSLQKVSA